MARYQVKEKASYLGKTWGGYFTGITENYSWARKQMEYRFMEYLHEYKSDNPKVSMGHMSCKLTIDECDYIQVSIEKLDDEVILDACV